jgi:hypothetical protein
MRLNGRVEAVERTPVPHTQRLVVSSSGAEKRMHVLSSSVTFTLRVMTYDVWQRTGSFTATSNCPHRGVS